jgi:uncharacterized protein GlcG (DUF336 family)
MPAIATTSRLLGALALLVLATATASAASAELPDAAKVKAALQSIVKEKNGGFGTDMWATIVDREGLVSVVTFSGAKWDDQWPGSRVISAQKANTANAFSLPKLAVSTAQLFSAVQPGGSLFGLQFSNPVNTEVANAGKAKKFGTPGDPMIGERIGGVIVFGGGLALYAADGTLLGGLGVSGDSAVADHIIAWKLRHALDLDHIPGGVSPAGDDNMVIDITDGKSASGWGHPATTPEATEIVKNLPTTHPIPKKK